MSETVVVMNRPKLPAWFAYPRVRLLIATAVVLVTAATLYVFLASSPQRVSVGVYVLNRSGIELRDVRIEFHGTALAAPDPVALVRVGEEYGYSTETSEPIPSRITISAVAPDGSRSSYGGLYPRHVVGRERFLEGHDMRIEVQPLLSVNVLFSRRRQPEPNDAAGSR